jgi:hypothetical protein
VGAHSSDHPHVNSRKTSYSGWNWAGARLLDSPSVTSSEVFERPVAIAAAGLKQTSRNRKRSTANDPPCQIADACALALHEDAYAKNSTRDIDKRHRSQQH